ncbi:beta-2 adrenergic receptor isoform X1 [Syngnathus acus]|uniref:beta-2 adrenergic receptor isoform X1 n=2 Tax=Syngnathus acus TaxID=161584 RepID=UPI001885FA43|nr:beta-2 adrenergic receptor isoform X1 [Syngnathus acus]XP_037129934.1 beta-2 adrenergic receptor isoform X1 [Syngnathus acus]XP_037129935.1 beta-2 adrenergic receptor isoform X1 [Syngnathus acus]XP_037129936.1 beta-2 adrenergic receptor isoform X1 [Syngnathus acus]
MESMDIGRAVVWWWRGRKGGFAVIILTVSQWREQEERDPYKAERTIGILLLLLLVLLQRCRDGRANVSVRPGIDCAMIDPVEPSVPDGAAEAPCTVCCCTRTNKILMVVFMALLILAIVFGNLLTLAVVLGTKRFRTPQGYLKASLAAADLAVGVFVVPLSVYAELQLMAGDSAPEWTASNSRSMSVHPCAVMGPIFAGCTLVSITTIFLMSIERSIAVLRPLHKDSVITRKRTSILIALSWLGSFFLAVSPLLFSREIVLEYNTCSRMCNYALGTIGEFPSQAWNILLLFPAFDFTLLGGTVAINIISLSSIRQHSKRRKHLAETECQKASKPTFSDIKAAKTIGTLTVAFTASFTPIAVFVVGNVLGNEWCNFSFFAFWILASNSCCNVIIYSVRDHKFRLCAQKLLLRDANKSSRRT